MSKTTAPRAPKADKAPKLDPVPKLIPNVASSPIVEGALPADHPDRGLDRVAVLEPTANVPYVVVPKGDPKDVPKEQKAAQDKAEKDAKDLADQKIKARDAVLKDREARAVSVRAIRTGFYPADGRIRKPGEIFDYVPVRDAKTGVVEELLPSWMQAVDGGIESRTPGETSPSFDNTPAATLTIGKDGSVSHASGSKVI